MSALTYFDSPMQFIDAFEAIGATPSDISDHNLGITGCASKASAIATARAGGDDGNVARALAMLERIQGQIETSERELMPAPFGGFVVVPEAMIGYPMAARRMIASESTTAPIRISVSVESSWKVKIDSKIERGIALLALVMAISKSRPVELYIHGDWSTSNDDLAIVQYRVPTSPLSIAQICHLMTEPRLTKSAIAHITKARHGLNGRGGWCKTFNEARERGDDEDHDGPYLRECRELMGWTDSDIVLPKLKHSDEKKDRVAWINGILARLSVES